MTGEDSDEKSKNSGSEDIEFQSASDSEAKDIKSDGNVALNSLSVSK